jgi:TonB family protein
VRVLKLTCLVVFLVVVGSPAQSPSNGGFPKPIYSELPTYPERARTAHVAGSVKMWFMMDESGGIAEAEIISGNSLLRDAAVKTVKSWKFRLEGIKPGARYETEFVYELNVQSKRGEPKLTVSMTDLRRVEIVSELYVVTIE